MPELSAPAKKLAGKIIDELRGRKGFDHLFDDLDAGIKKELKQSLAGICEEALADRYQAGYELGFDFVSGDTPRA